MRYSIRLFISILAISLVAGAAACGDDNDDDNDNTDNPDESIVELIDDENFSTLRTALETAELENVLKGKEEYTLFAPTNEAFDRLDDGVLDELLEEENRDELVELLQFHLLEGTISSDELEAGTYETLAGIDVTIDIDGNDIFYQNAFVSDVDWFAKNGVIHTLDDVAFPDVDDEKEEDEKEKDEEDDKPDRTILELLADDDDFSTLVTAVEAAGLDEALDGDDALTLFAPTNEAFDALPDGVLDDLLEEENRDQLVELLLFHVVDGTVASADLTKGPIATLASINAYIKFVDSQVFYQNALVSDVDWFAKNGVIHTLDDVAMLDEKPKKVDDKKDKKKADATIFELLADDAEFSTLVTALEVTGLDEVLDGDDALTLFAPTNAAFDALPDGVLDDLLEEENRDELIKLLLFHVVDGKITSADLQEGRIETMAGISAFVDIHNDTVFYQNARVSDVDWHAKNGVIHTLDDVAMPDKKVDDKSIYQTLVADENFSTLVTALELTGLDDALDGADHLTLFAPTNDAFDALPDGVLDDLLKEENRDELTQILLFHVIAGTLTAQGIEVGFYDTLAGIDVFIDIEDDSVFYQNAMVIGFDRFARNGVIHTLDEVAIPPEE